MNKQIEIDSDKLNTRQTNCKGLAQINKDVERAR